MKFTKIARQGMALLAVVSTLAMAQATLTEDETIAKVKADMAAKGLSITPEQEVQLRLSYQRNLAFQQQIQTLAGARRGLPVQAPAQAVAVGDPGASVSTDDLARKIASLPAPHPVAVVQKKDGFEIDGVRQLDPEGRIVREAVNGSTSDFVYLVSRSNGAQVLKRGRGPDGQLFMFATVSGHPGSWNVRAMDGQSMDGDTLILSPQGLFIARDSAVFELQPGKPIRSFAIPDGWSPVPHQRGDVGSTRNILLERNASSRPASGGLMDLIKSTKRLVGAETPDDYQLFNLDTRVATTLAIDISDKNVVRMSQCRRKNAVVNVCQKSDSYESLWDPSGGPNLSHYFWRVYWSDTPEGPMAVVNQRGSTEVRLFDLRSGKEVVAFHRGMGIQSAAARQTVDGKVRIEASWMFQKFRLEDARGLLDAAPDMRGKVSDALVVAGKSEAEVADAAPSPQAAASEP